MTPAVFIEKWSRSELRERQGAQSHFNDLCALIGEQTPTDADPLGASYCFERGASKVGGGDGWADVWRRGCFGWEYKGKHKDLNAALRQLQIYAPDLENPPYLVVCDMERIIVHTNWTNTVRRTFTYAFEDLREPARLDELRHVFRGSEALKPGLTPQELTAKVAARFGDLGRRLQERRHDPQAVAHFLNRLIFCLFAEDAEILPRGLVTRLLTALSRAEYFKPAQAKAQLDGLFSTMRTGGFFGADVVRWFNGGLFDDAQALPLERADLVLLADTAREHDWSNIDPAVFGTMFEEALKTTGRRAALGAHYTGREKILKVVEPVVIRPLAAEWEAHRLAIAAAMADVAGADTARQAVFERLATTLSASDAEALLGGEARQARQSDNLELFADVGAVPLPNGARQAIRAAQPDLAAIARRRTAARNRATEIRDAFLARLSAFRVLDPACGSGNFLYVALHALRDIELRALLDAERLGVPQVAPRVGLDAVRGIEIEAYAAELARVTLWIGNLQWERRNGYTAYAEPILHALDTIEHRDALLNPDGTEAAWPAADAIVGNPPFLGGKRLRDGLGDATVERLFTAYRGRVPAEADLVCYWVEKAWRAVGGPATGDRFGGGLKAGLVTTNSIRGGANRRVLEPIAAAGALREAWADEPWALKGAAVRVSMLGFGWGFSESRLDGAVVERINADLTGAGVDLTQAKRLTENDDTTFIGTQKNGEFNIAGDVARLWLKAPLNPNGRPNADVVRPSWLGSHIARRWDDTWIVYFSIDMKEDFASLYEQPFEYVLKHIKPVRQEQRRAIRKRRWWLLGEPMPELRSRLDKISKFIATPRVSKHRLFCWLPSIVIPDCQLVIICREDDTTFGILQSKFHAIWSLRLGTWLGVGNDLRYTPSTTFETFPFPQNLTPNIPAADYADDLRAKTIAEAAAELNRLRENWLNPSDLVRIEPEVVPGYPDRILPKDAAAAAVLKTRTLTKLYNDRPAWLDNAHRRLDAAVASAYGWPADLDDDAILARLFALNQERAAAGR